MLKTRPELDGADVAVARVVVAGEREHILPGMPGDRERARVALDRAHLLARLHVTDVYEVVLARRRQQLRVVVEAECAHRPLQPGKCPQTAQGLGVPQTRDCVGGPGRKVASALVKLQADTIGQVRLDVAHLAQVRVAQDENRAEARGDEEQVALPVPRDLVHLELELPLAGEAVVARVDERDQVVLVARGDALAVRRPANVDVLAFRGRAKLRFSFFCLCNTKLKFRAVHALFKLS